MFCRITPALHLRAQLAEQCSSTHVHWRLSVQAPVRPHFPYKLSIHSLIFTDEPYSGDCLTTRMCAGSPPQTSTVPGLDL